MSVIIDCGPDSAGYLTRVDKRWFTTVFGNHKEMALAALNEGDMSLVWPHAATVPRSRILTSTELIPYLATG